MILNYNQMMVLNRPAEYRNLAEKSWRIIPDLNKEKSAFYFMWVFI